MVTKKQPAQANIASKLLEQNIQYQDSNKIRNKVAIITYGESDIEHAIAVYFAKEGANIVIAYLNEYKDTKKIQEEVLDIGLKCLSGDLSQEKFCRRMLKQTIKQFSKLNILINNAGEQFSKEIASSYVFLASENSSYISGQFFHPKNGVIING